MAIRHRKRTQGRSKAYPAVNLETAVVYLEKITGEIGDGPHGRDTVAQALGYSRGVGMAARKVAALVHFGLMSREGSEYSATDLAKVILFPRAASERQEALLSAFLNPTLYEELVGKYEEGGRVPRQLKNILARDHGITASASEEAATVFLESGRFAGAIGDDGSLRVNRAAGNDEGGIENENLGESDWATGSAEAPSTRQEPRWVSAPPRDERQVFDVVLSSGTARLVVPRLVNSRDIAKLKKVIEVLETDVEDGKA